MAWVAGVRLHVLRVLVQRPEIALAESDVRLPRGVPDVPTEPPEQGLGGPDALSPQNSNCVGVTVSELSTAFQCSTCVFLVSIARSLKAAGKGSWKARTKRAPPFIFLKAHESSMLNDWGHTKSGVVYANSSSALAIAKRRGACWKAPAHTRECPVGPRETGYQAARITQGSRH